MAYQTIETRPLAGALGAIIAGIDLSQDLDNAQASDLHQALLDHCVIFFRDQRLTPERHLALGRRFGTLNIHEFVEAMPGHPEILVVAKYEGDTKNFGGGWHSDVTYLDEPALGSILYALDVPDYGGDTMFANQYMAYETLSPGMQRMLDGLTAIHSARDIYGIDADNTNAPRKGLSAMKIMRSEAAHRETEHPVVRTHPETGRKGALRQPQLHRSLQGHDRRGKPAAVEFPVGARCQAGIYLPLPLEEGFGRVLGQSVRAALCGQRLPGPEAGDAPRHD
jgi:taurine dioxygenase